MKHPRQTSRRLDRRQFLRGGVLATATMPVWIRRSLAADVQPLRLICWPLFNGAEAGRFYPGGADAATLSGITEPIRKWASLATFIKGVNISGSVNHYAIRSMYTGGNVSSYTSPDPTVPSIDQLIAQSIARTAPTPIKSLHLGAIPADSLNSYQKGQSMVFYSPARIDYEANPVTAYDRLFGGAGGGAGPGPTPKGLDLTLDAAAVIDGEMDDLRRRLMGTDSELAKLDRHRDSLKEIRPSGNGPTLPTTPGAGTMGPLPSVEKLRPMLQGNAKDAYKHEYFSDVFDAQLDIMARALTLGLTRVATMQAGSADNDLIVPVGRGYPHHVTSHGNQATFSMCQNYYFGKMARLLTALEAPDPLDPGRTVLDNTLIVMIAECLPVSHSSNGVPTLLVGKLGGKIKTGSVISQGGTNKNVMATVLKAFNLDGAHFGNTLTAGVLA
jgi:hypothetical protein